MTTDTKLEYIPNNPLRGKVILMNGPPNAGKDFATEKLVAATDADHREFKDILHNIAIAMTGLSREKYFEIYENKSWKEDPHPDLLGMSPRGLLIWISEDVCKPKFGEQFFGMPAAGSVDIETGAVFSDSGFPEEVFPIANKVGAENVYVVRFSREGCSFEGDSRNYLQPDQCPEGVKFIDLKNDGDINDFCRAILSWVIYDNRKFED
mgnify:CR=1 FL=1